MLFVSYVLTAAVGAIIGSWATTSKARTVAVVVAVVIVAVLGYLVGGYMPPHPM